MFGFKSKQEKGAVQEKGVVQEGMTLEQVRTAMLELMKEESVNHHRMGQLYNYVVDGKLAENAKYKDARAYFGKHLADLSWASLTTYGAVARNFSEAISRRYGVTCLYLLLIYKEAADMQVNHAEPGGTVIEVPGENGAVTSKPFGECSVAEMRLAIRRKRKPASSKPLPSAELAFADKVREAVAGRFGPGEAVQVQVRNHKGKAVLDFKGIPLSQLDKLGEVLSAPPSLMRPVPAATGS
jgi:hypothetical protein